MEETIFVYRLNDTMQFAAPKAYSFKDIIKVGIFDNLEINFRTLDL